MIEERSSVDHEDAIQPDGFMRGKILHGNLRPFIYIYI